MSNFHPLEVVDRGSETKFKLVKIQIIYLLASSVSG